LFILYVIQCVKIDLLLFILYCHLFVKMYAVTLCTVVDCCHHVGGTSFIHLQGTLLPIPEDITAHSYRCENLKSDISWLKKFPFSGFI
jgi:hypothetical protein